MLLLVVYGNRTRVTSPWHYTPYPPPLAGPQGISSIPVRRLPAGGRGGPGCRKVGYTGGSGSGYTLAIAVSGPSPPRAAIPRESISCILSPILRGGGGGGTLPGVHVPVTYRGHPGRGQEGGVVGYGPRV